MHLDLSTTTLSGELNVGFKFCEVGLELLIGKIKGIDEKISKSVLFLINF